MLLRRVDVYPRRRRGLLPIIWLALVFVLMPLGRLAAQQPAQLPPVSQQDIDALLATLQDPAARDKLIQQLRALKAAQAQQAQTVEPEGLGAILLSSLSERVSEASDALVATTTVVLDLPSVITWTTAELAKPEVRTRWFDVLMKIGITLLAALAAEWLTLRLLARPRSLFDARIVDRYWLRWPLAVTRLFIELLPIVAFLAVAYGVLPVTEPSPITRLVALTIINANVLVRVIIAVASVLLAPKAPGSR